MNIPHITDKYYITYGIFYLLGILTFIPNYFVITASTYWLYKFRYLGPIPPDGDVFPAPPNERNMLQASFFSTYYIITQLSLIVFIVLTAVYSKKLPPPEKRITAALLCSLVFYIVNLIFVNIETDAFQIAFFMVVMCIACFLGVSGAVIIVSLFEMVSNFPSEYYSAILTAQALCGVISAIIQIITITLSACPATGGLIFFGIGTVMVCVTLTIYTYSKKNSQYFIYHVDNMVNDPMAHTIQPSRRFPSRMWHRVREPFKKTKIYMISLTIVCGTTAIMYPGFMSLVAARDSDGRSHNKWVEFYFVPVITFLIASLCDLLGRHLATKIRKPVNEWVLLTMAILRLTFIPLIVYSNAQPRCHLPVLFYDVPYVIFTIMFMFSNGYLINLCVITVPTRAENSEEKSLITVMAVLSGVFSTAMCSFLSLMLVHLL